MGILLPLTRTPTPTALFGPAIGVLVEQARRQADLAVVGIDIPIGLGDEGARAADVLVAATLGARRSSVFATPVRAALEAPTHAEANARNRELTGLGVSAQAYALRAKVLEVDDWRFGAGLPPCYEVHPELSFAVLGGRPARHPKRTWAGMVERRELLRGGGIELEGELGEAGGRAGPDDVLDAAVVAWSASRVAAGVATPLPDPPVRLRDGTSCAIWS